jgi:hypothetical protein
VPGVEEVELAVGQPLVEELAVGRWHHRVSLSGDDLHRRLDLRQQIAQDRKVGGVGADVAHRLDEAVAVVGGQVVLPDVVGERVSLDVGECVGDDLPRVGGAVGLEIGGVDPVLEHPT